MAVKIVSIDGKNDIIVTSAASANNVPASGIVGLETSGSITSFVKDNKLILSGEKTDLTDYYNVEEINEFLDEKQDILNFEYNDNDAISAINGSALAIPEIDLSNYYTKTETNSAINEVYNYIDDTSAYLDEVKQDNLEFGYDNDAISSINGSALAIPEIDLSNYYTKTETSGKEELSAEFNTKQDIIANKKDSSIPYLETSGSEPSWEVIESSQINAHGTAEEGKTYTIAINDRPYKTVCIGGKLWLAENYVDESHALYTDEDYGSYFMANTISRYIPQGWHLPSKEEWELLQNAHSDELEKLFSTDWHTDPSRPDYIQCTNELKLNLTPGGYYNRNTSEVTSQGYRSYYATSTFEVLSQSSQEQRVYVQLKNCVERKSQMIGFDWDGPRKADSSYPGNIRLIKDDLDVSGPDCWKTFKGKKFMAIADDEGNTFKDFYLKTSAAQQLYQPKGDYASSADVTVLNTYYGLTTTGWKDIATNFYDKRSVDESLNSKQDILTFGYDEYEAISSINNSALAGKTYSAGENVKIENNVISVSGKKTLSFDRNSFKISSDENARVVGLNVPATDDIYGVNSAGMWQKINADGGGSVTGAYVPLSATQCTIGIGNTNTNQGISFTQGFSNTVQNDNAFAQGTSNTVSQQSMAQGIANSAYNNSFAQGGGAYANTFSFAQGNGITANNTAMVQGRNSYSDTESLAVGENVSAACYSLAVGNGNSAFQDSIAVGLNNTAKNNGIAQGYQNSAFGEYSITLGNMNKATSNFTFAQGRDNTVAGENAIAFGQNNNATYSYTFAVGNSNSAIYSHAVTIGSQNIASGEFSVALSQQNSAYGNNAIVAGYKNLATGHQSVALGYLNSVSGTNGVALGYNNNVYSVGSVAIGYLNTTKGNYSVAEGYHNYTEGEAAHVEGAYNQAIGPYSHAEGSACTATQNVAHAEGNFTRADNYSHAEGKYTYANNTSHVEGLSARATGNYSHAEGFETSALTSNAHAEGSKTLANGYQSHAEGMSTTAGHYSHAEGIQTSANGQGSSPAHAEGYKTTALNVAHAEGSNTYASGGDYQGPAHAEGYYTSADAKCAHAEGRSTYAHAENSHAEGNGTTAYGGNSHAEGDGTLANNGNAHSEGWHSSAMGNCSHVEGETCLASGSYSHAQNYRTSAIGDASMTIGSYTIAGANNMLAIGSYNKTSANGVFVVGNGTSTTRSDAFIIYPNGGVSAAGNISANGVELGGGSTVNLSGENGISVTPSGDGYVIGVSANSELSAGTGIAITTAANATTISLSGNMSALMTLLDNKPATGQPYIIGLDSNGNLTWLAM